MIIKTKEPVRDYEYWAKHCRETCINVDDACDDCFRLDLYESDYSAEVERVVKAYFARRKWWQKWWGRK